MSENRSLIHWIVAIFSVAVLLVAGVMAHDRGIELAIVDHLFDFHINEHAVRDELDRMTQEKHDKEQKTKEWVNDIRWERDSESGSNDVGTVGPPDRDK